MISRRSMLHWSAGGAALYACRAFGAVPVAPVPGSLPTLSVPFSVQALFDAARAAASAGYVAPRIVPADAAAQVSYEAADAVSERSERSLFYEAGGDGLRAALRPRLGPDGRGFPLLVYRVDGNSAVPLTYDAGDFDFAGIDAGSLSPELGFGGFDVRAPRESVGRYETLLRFDRNDTLRLQDDRRFCGSFVRPFGLAIGDGEHESIPAVRAAYVQRPDRDRCLVYLTADGPGGAGVYTLQVHAAGGGEPVITLEGTFYPRGRPMRPCLMPFAASVYDDDRGRLNRSADAMLLHNSNGEVLWRPLRNRRRLNVSVFLDQGLRLCGFVRRRNAESLFDDPEQAEIGGHGTVFIPSAGFDRGRTVLTEVPAPDPRFNNMLMHREPELNNSGPIVFGGRLAPFTDAPIDGVPLRVAFSRLSNDRCAVYFSGAGYFAGAPLQPEVSASAGKIEDLSLRTYDSGRRVAVRFRCDLQGASSADLRVRILYAGRGMSEVWTSPLFADD